jgi:hypothetical protein
MIEISQFTLALLLEALLGLSLVSGLLVFFNFRRKSQIRKAARHLVERIEQDKAKRSKRLSDLLTEGYGYEQSECDQVVHDIVQSEMRLYQNMVNSYLNQDVVAFQQTDVDVENLVLAYQGLRVPEAGSVPAQAPAAASSGDSEEFTRLKEENERLSEELHVTMDTMGRMLNEYSTMFGGGEGTSVDDTETSPGAENEESGEVINQGEDQAERSESLDVIVEESSSDDSDNASDLGIIDEADIKEMIESVDTPLDTDEVPESDVLETSQVTSLADELDPLDIETPDSAETTDFTQEELDAKSLEDEWAKLLEEEEVKETPEEKEKS